jgi:large-conductance mechanosensitive channel
VSIINHGSLIWLVINVALLFLIVFGIIKFLHNIGKIRRQIEKNTKDIKELQDYIKKE